MSTQWMKHALIVSVLTVLMILPALAQQRRTAAPAPRGPAKPAAGTPDSQRLSQILARIEERLTVLENQVISQPPTTNQMSSTPDLATMEARITALENQAISQPPATNQTGSTSGELTCTKLTVVNGAGQPRVMLGADQDMDSTPALPKRAGSNVGNALCTRFTPRSSSWSGHTAVRTTRRCRCR